MVWNRRTASLLRRGCRKALRKRSRRGHGGSDFGPTLLGSARGSRIICAATPSSPSVGDLLCRRRWF